MATLALDEFLSACVQASPEGPGLSMDELYGLYVSWCALSGRHAAQDRTFRKVLASAGIEPNHRTGRCAGLSMTGPAAFDYLVHRELPLVPLIGSPDGEAAEVEAVATGSAPPSGSWRPAA